MVTTVNAAFDEFLSETVNLERDVTRRARASRDWLLRKVHEFPSKAADFPELYEEKDIAFGSFARRTKIRPLDDIDLIVCLHAAGGTYVEGHESIVISVPSGGRLADYCNADGRTLNSTKILNRFRKALASVPQYSSANVSRNGEAVVLDLLSYSWKFDVVPAFFTTTDASGRDYYLIPDGSGGWKKTDPRRDRDRISRINQGNDGRVLNIIRIMKYWQKRTTTPTVPSYLFETMVSEVYGSDKRKASAWVDCEIAPVLKYVAEAVSRQVWDPKDIEGNLNSVSFDERDKIRQRAIFDAKRAEEARQFENGGQQAKCINQWRAIFGGEFPRFE